MDRYDTTDDDVTRAGVAVLAPLRRRITERKTRPDRTE